MLKTNTYGVYYIAFCFKWVLYAGISLATSNALAAKDEMAGLHHQMQHLREQMQQTQELYKSQINVLEQRILELEKANNYQQRNNTLPVASVPESDEHHSQPAGFQWSLSGLVAMGGSTANGNELKQLQAGAHDPRKNGFTIQALSLAVHARFNEQLDATASIVSHIEPDGESLVELEQAFIQAQGLTDNLSVKAGQYFLDFGEENTRHPDDWDFVDVPFLITRLFGGDKLRSQGIHLTWQTPMPWRSTLSLGISNPVGETATSFLYEQGETVGGHVLLARDVESPGDLLYLLKWSHRLPVAGPHHIGFGASALFGPNATGDSTDTQIYGLDFEWTKYANAHSQKPLFNWRTELMLRRYEAGDNNDPTHETLKDYGLFSQAVWQLDNKWALGLRAEYADSNGGKVNDPLRDNRKRLSLNITRPLAKSVKWRLQYNHDRDNTLSDNNADSVWLQLVYQAGSHNEHE